MALAVSSFEVRISETLVNASEPMTADAILGTLKRKYGMINLKLSDVRTSLLGTTVYKSVAGSVPPRWYIGTNETEKDDRFRPGPCKLPPLIAVAPGEFRQAFVALVGDCSEKGRLRASSCLEGAAALGWFEPQDASGSWESMIEMNKKMISFGGRQTQALVVVGSENRAPRPPASVDFGAQTDSGSYYGDIAQALFETLGIPVYSFEV